MKNMISNHFANCLRCNNDKTCESQHQEIHIIMELALKETKIVSIWNIKQKKYYPNLWIGLAHVKPKPSNDLLGSAIGAYAQIVCVAKSEPEFLQKSQEYFNLEDFELCAMEDVERLSERLDAEQHPDEELLQTITEMDADSVVLGTMHSYENADLKLN